MIDIHIVSFDLKHPAAPLTPEKATTYITKVHITKVHTKQYVMNPSLLSSTTTPTFFLSPSP
jgi:hypothetical protein